jgi:hypothetical protein
LSEIEEPSVDHRAVNSTMPVPCDVVTDRVVVKLSGGVLASPRTPALVHPGVGEDAAHVCVKVCGLVGAAPVPVELREGDRHQIVGRVPVAAQEIGGASQAVQPGDHKVAVLRLFRSPHAETPSSATQETEPGAGKVE